MKGTYVVLYNFDKEQFYILVKDGKGNVVSSEVVDLTNVIQKEKLNLLLIVGKLWLMDKNQN
ncbi:hypothetical protein HMPREF9714_02576 [Myroides odoratimimus CCUG 12901]|uniref:hypothetical protein n=1 Tax=Myroides odoratimimus TaxID=76832 RepID=UPI0002460774|nr:hypothetical protein [Myroides odoratimimus]EHO07496.1 hypothetical protein HMPREF9714_02576 [Myroides odoratimimus CCUG 12901]MEC4026813.1 hypothetical protein [Myroides odoratimimus]MEC4042679.1 hypothetical protein [Myroides odoratimimus]MEC4150710.1 hypothetical protein [Myroides odoratimimus]